LPHMKYDVGAEYADQSDRHPTKEAKNLFHQNR
jgi:hypothetical protein